MAVPGAEYRIDPADGVAYTVHDFVGQYGGTADAPPEQWLTAPLCDLGSGVGRGSGVAQPPPVVATPTWPGGHGAAPAAPSLGFGMQGGVQHAASRVTHPERWEGTLKNFSVDAGFGFIICPKARLMYEADVWVYHQELPESCRMPGQDVNFTITFRNKYGRPQALDVRPGPAVGMAAAMMPSGRVSGTVVTWNQGRGYGFVSQDCGGPNLFLHVAELPLGLKQTEPGVRLTYVVGEAPNGKGLMCTRCQIDSFLVQGAGRGTPMASSGAGQGTVISIGPPPGTRVSGVVKSFSVEQGAGLIACDKDTGLGDLIVYPSHLPVHLRSPGASVTFTVGGQDREGPPQAEFVRASTKQLAGAPVQHAGTAWPGAAAAAPAAPAPPPGGVGPAGVEEHRVDKSDGQAYPLKGFIVAYGGSATSPPAEWLNAAPVRADRLDFAGAAKKAGAQQAAAAAPAPAAPAPGLERWSGSVKSFDKKKGSGFISSHRARQEGWADVWASGDQMKALLGLTIMVGTAVTFAVQYSSDGRPCAVDVMQAGMESSKAPNRSSGYALVGGTYGSDMGFTKRAGNEPESLGVWSAAQTPPGGPQFGEPAAKRLAMAANEGIGKPNGGSLQFAGADTPRPSACNAALAAAAGTAPAAAAEPFVAVERLD